MTPIFEFLAKNPSLKDEKDWEKQKPTDNT